MKLKIILLTSSIGIFLSDSGWAYLPSDTESISSKERLAARGRNFVSWGDSWSNDAREDRLPLSLHKWFNAARREVAESDPQVMMRLAEKRAAIEDEGLEFSIETLCEIKARAEAELAQQLKPLQTQIDELRAAFSQKKDRLKEETDFLANAFSFALGVANNSEIYKKDRNFKKRLATKELAETGCSFESAGTSGNCAEQQDLDIDYLRQFLARNFDTISHEALLRAQEVEKSASWRRKVSEAIQSVNGASLENADLAESYEIVSLGVPMGGAPKEEMVSASSYTEEETIEGFRAKKSQYTHAAFAQIRDVLEKDPQWIRIQAAATQEALDPSYVAQLKQEYFHKNFTYLQRRLKLMIEERHQRILEELAKESDKAISRIYLRHDAIARTMKERLAPTKELLNELYARHRALSASYETYRRTVEQRHENMLEEGIWGLLGL